MPFTIAWFIAFLILLGVEIITIGLVSIWFAIGALAALIISFFVDSIIVQLLVFISISIIALIITKPFIKKFKVQKIIPTNSDMVIGKIGDVTKKIEDNHYGEVKVFGNTWTAYSDEEIDVGSRVKVLKIDGVKLFVQKEVK